MTFYGGFDDKCFNEFLCTGTADKEEIGSVDARKFMELVSTLNEYHERGK